MPLEREHGLLLRCATATLDEAGVAEIAGVVAEGVDWTVLIAGALKHNVLPLLDRSLRRLPPGLLPADLDAAMAERCAEMRARSEVLAVELGDMLADLAGQGIEALPIKGPVLALQAYGDIGLRTSRDLDILVRETDTAATLAALARRGYAAKGGEGLTPAQIRRIRRAEGQDLLWRERDGIAVEPHWTLAPDKLAVSVDYPGLFARSIPVPFGGRTVTATCPEDTLIILALHGGKETWWRLNWICDIAALVRAWPDLDYDATLRRAGPQGCRRMVLLALALAHRLLGSPVPAPAQGALAEPAMMRMVATIERRLFDADVIRPPWFDTVSALRLGAHDGLMWRCSYLVRTLTRPSPRHIKMVALPDPLGFGYVPIKVIHDFALLPAWRLARQMRRRKS